MSEVPTETDRLVAKMTAMEVMLLTLVRPLAQNPKFWADLEAMTKAFEASNPQMDAVHQRRWAATRGFLDEWQRALTPQ